jgi:hypothetical protein
MERGFKQNPKPSPLNLPMTLTASATVRIANITEQTSCLCLFSVNSAAGKSYRKAGAYFSKLCDSTLIKETEAPRLLTQATTSNDPHAFTFKLPL